MELSSPSNCPSQVSHMCSMPPNLDAKTAHSYPWNMLAPCENSTSLCTPFGTWYTYGTLKTIVGILATGSVLSYPGDLYILIRLEFGLCKHLYLLHYRANTIYNCFGDVVFSEFQRWCTPPCLVSWWVWPP